MRSQAIPMATYRRRMLFTQMRPPLVVLLAGVALSSVAGIQGSIAFPRGAALPSISREAPVSLDCAVGNGECPAVAHLPAAMSLETPEVAPPPPIGQGVAPVDGVGEAALTNIQIAISFLDGVVIDPGAQLSFDDTARTWDYYEDERYVLGTATSIYGLVTMRGGGVCWLSTALWRAALAAGLRTDFRESHFGLVDGLGPGLDATNTLVIRNDSSQPITVRAWVDHENVYAALFGDESLDRIATVRGPVAVGSGRYAAYQDVAWDDGAQTTSEFVSRYYW